MSLVLARDVLTRVREREERLFGLASTTGLKFPEAARSNLDVEFVTLPDERKDLALVNGFVSLSDFPKF